MERLETSTSGAVRNVATQGGGIAAVTLLVSRPDSSSARLAAWSAYGTAIPRELHSKPRCHLPNESRPLARKLAKLSGGVVVPGGAATRTSARPLGAGRSDARCHPA